MYYRAETTQLDYLRNSSPSIMRGNHTIYETLETRFLSSALTNAQGDIVLRGLTYLEHTPLRGFSMFD